MQETILIGCGEKIMKAPEHDWREMLAGAPQFFSSRLAFMTPDHHRLRNFAVVELPRNEGRPLRPEDISQRLGLPVARLGEVLDDLERNLFFLVRNEAGAVSWAFPVTSDQTPHRVRFPGGERAFAA